MRKYVRDIILGIVGAIVCVVSQTLEKTSLEQSAVKQELMRLNEETSVNVSENVIHNVGNTTNVTLVIGIALVILAVYLAAVKFLKNKEKKNEK